MLASITACSPEPQRRSICSPGTAHRQAGVKRGHASDRRRVTVGIALPEQDVVDLLRRQSGSLDQRGDHGRRELGRRDVAEHAAEAPHRRPQGLADHGVAHQAVTVSSQLTRSRDVGRVDVVSCLGLAVVDLEACRLQQVPGGASERHVDHRVPPTMGDEHARAAVAGQVRVPALDRGDEAGEGEDPGRGRAVGVQPQGVAHHRAHREPAEHGRGRAGSRSGPRARRAAEPGRRGRRGRCPGPDSRRAGRGTSGSREIPAAAAARAERRRAAGAGDRARRPAAADPARWCRGRDGAPAVPAASPAAGRSR